MSVTSALCCSLSSHQKSYQTGDVIEQVGLHQRFCSTEQQLPRAADPHDYRVMEEWISRDGSDITEAKHGVKRQQQQQQPDDSARSCNTVTLSPDGRRHQTPVYTWTVMLRGLCIILQEKAHAYVDRKVELLLTMLVIRGCDE